MQEALVLINQLDKIEALIKDNPNIAVRAFGILLLGHKFDDEVQKSNEVRDPTDYILNDPSLLAPNL